MVQVHDAAGKPVSLPGLAPVAMQQGRYAARAIRERAPRPSTPSLPLPRQGQPRHDRPRKGRRRHQGPPAQRVARVAHMALRAPLLPDRPPESTPRLHPLDLQLRHARPRRPADHRAGNLTAPAAAGRERPGPGSVATRRATPGGSALHRSGGDGWHRPRTGYSIFSPSMPGGAGGSLGSMRSSACNSNSATARLLTQLRSAGTTYQGAHSDDVAVTTSSRRPEVGVELLADLEVVQAELPPLLGIVHALLKALPLLLLRDVQEHLHHRRALVREHSLPFADVRRATLPDLLRGELQHANGDDVLVVRPVEDADLSARRERGVHPPQVVVSELGRCRRPERRDTTTLRAENREDPPDDAVLAGCVETLEHAAERCARPRRTGASAAGSAVRGARRGVASRPPCPRRRECHAVSLRDGCLRSGLDPQHVDHGRTLVGASAPN